MGVAARARLNAALTRELGARRDIERALADLDVALTERPAHLDALALRSVTYGWFAQRWEGEERAALTALRYSYPVLSTP